MNRTLIVILLIAFALGALFLALRPDPPSDEPQGYSGDLEIRRDTMTPDEISVGEGDKCTSG